MSKDDQSTIEKFARGAGSRDLAIEAHRRNIRLDGVRGNDHQRFMAEVDNPAPDLNLRAIYRRKLTGRG